MRYGNGYSVIPSPIFAHGNLLASRPDGTGDVIDTGIAACFDARTGTVHWEERLKGNYSASPLAAEGRIYFQNENCTGT